MTTGIYIFTNKLNGKQYVGQSVNLERRIKYHKKLKNLVINKAIQKYGWENFSLQIFKIPIELLDVYEKLIIIACNSLSPNGYNLKEGGGAIGKMTDEAKEKISKSLKGRKCSEDVKLNMTLAQRGRIVKKDTREKISNSLKGQKHSDERKLKQSENTKGRKLSEEAKLNISKGSKGKILSESHKKNISENLMGKNHSLETKQKISDTLKNKPPIFKICPYCGAQGKAPNIFKHHFKNCEMIDK